MNCLLLDTTTGVTALAVAADERLLGESLLHTEKPHSERLLPLIEQTLKLCGLRAADLDLLVATQGPGSFTGIRIGIATAQGLAQALRIPVLGLTSLEAMSWAGWGREETTVVLLDARKSEWYTAAYRWQRVEQVESPASRLVRVEVLPPQAVRKDELPGLLAELPGDFLLVGDGCAEAAPTLTALEARLHDPLPEHTLMHGAYLLREWHYQVALGSQPAGLTPYYIRLPEAEARRRAQGLPT
jgi:tRNA threonylcarbamoyladenosine biosynthesis protein TsaB